MTAESLRKGNELYERIERMKDDVKGIDRHQFMRGHPCTTALTDTETAINTKIRDYAKNVLVTELRRLEKEFSALK